MVIQFETRRTRLQRLDARRRLKYVAQFRARWKAWATGELPVEDLCAHAGAALDGYAAETLEALCRSPLDSCERFDWITEQYEDGLSTVGAAIRDEIADSSTRHAVAQTLQERLFRAELRLRDVHVGASHATSQHY